MEQHSKRNASQDAPPVVAKRKLTEVGRIVKTQWEG